MRYRRYLVGVKQTQRAWVRRCSVDLCSVALFAGSPVKEHRPQWSIVSTQSWWIA